MVRLADAIRRADKKAGKKKGTAVRSEDERQRRGMSEDYEAKTGNEEMQVRPSVSSEDIYEGLCDYMEEVGDKIKKGERFDIEEGSRLINAMVSNTRKVLDDLHRLTLLSVGSAKNNLATHAANVSVNAILMGIGFEYSMPKQIELGTAAIFHDLGMYMVPDSIRQKKGKLTSSEMEFIKQHPKDSYNILLEYGEEYHWLAEIVYQEHEKLDGSGYPRGLKGDQIHEYASIIGIIDIYDALIHNRPQRSGLSPAYAMKKIIGRSKGLFPTPIIKHLLCQLSIFPVRSYVKLNNDSIGMVVRTNSLWPLKPTVSLLYDAQGKKVNDGKIIDLCENPLLYIKDVIMEEDVPDFL